MSRSPLSASVGETAELLEVLACGLSVDVLEACAAESENWLCRPLAGRYADVLGSCAAALDMDCCAAADMALMVKRCEVRDCEVLEVSLLPGQWLRVGTVWRLVLNGRVLVRLVPGDGPVLPAELVRSVLRLALNSAGVDLSGPSSDWPELRATLALLCSSCPLPNGGTSAGSLVAEWVVL